MSRRLGSFRALVAPLIVAGGLLLPVSPSVEPVQAATPCPRGAVTLDDLIRLARDGGPIARRFPPIVTTLNERAYACLGSRPVRLVAYVAGPFGVGGARSWWLTPRWVDGAGLFLFATSRRVDGVVEGPAHTAAVPPRFGDLQARFRNRWVVVTGRFGDPVSRACRGHGEDGPNDRQAIAYCRAIFVISSIALLRGPSTSTEGAPPTGSPAAGPIAPVRLRPAALDETGPSAVVVAAGFVVGGILGLLAPRRGVRRRRPHTSRSSSSMNGGA